MKSDLVIKIVTDEYTSKYARGVLKHTYTIGSKHRGQEFFPLHCYDLQKTREINRKEVPSVYNNFWMGEYVNSAERGVYGQRVLLCRATKDENNGFVYRDIAEIGFENPEAIDGLSKRMRYWIGLKWEACYLNDNFYPAKSLEVLMELTDKQLEYLIIYSNASTYRDAKKILAKVGTEIAPQ